MKKWEFPTNYKPRIYILTKITLINKLEFQFRNRNLQFIFPQSI